MFHNCKDILVSFINQSILKKKVHYDCNAKKKHTSDWILDKQHLYYYQCLKIVDKYINKEFIFLFLELK